MRRLLALTAAMALIAACAGQGGGTTSLVDSTTTSGPTTTTPEGSTTETTIAPSTIPPTGVGLADTGMGRIVVDPDGMTIYVFTVDAGGESACYDTCADSWPAVPGETPIAPDLDTASLDFGTTERTDGSSQLTLNGRPLYLFAGDDAPGDTNGQGLNGVWFVVGSNGEMITEAPTESASSTTTPMDEYGY